MNDRSDVRSALRPLAGRRLATVFAHPDDETFATGVALARYAAAGVHCSVFTATDGGAGKSSGVPVGSPGELAAIRRNELHLAARHLGVRTVVAKGHPDKGLAGMDAEQLVEEIVAFLRHEQPDVVITFGPEGAPTGHPDHRTISRAATAAWFLASLPTECSDAGPPHRSARLYYATYAAPASIGERTFRLGLPATARLDAGPWLQRKREAFLLHATQRVNQPAFDAHAATPEEWFTLAAGIPQPDDVVDDLFDGL